jgi:hypothetical protein
MLVRNAAEKSVLLFASIPLLDRALLMGRHDKYAAGSDIGDSFSAGIAIGAK